MDLAERLEGLAIMAENVKKLDPKIFDQEPVRGFIDALCGDLRKIADDWLEDIEG